MGCEGLFGVFGGRIVSYGDLGENNKKNRKKVWRKKNDGEGAKRSSNKSDDG